MPSEKVLALVLAFACAFTMFAGAAFTDQADISVDADAVDTLVALGVIDGYNDGSFQPEKTVKRAEMAKMIYVLRTGNSDASAYNDDATSFTDIGDHWARGYIKYCQSMGIIAGKSATIFAPEATVTTQEAAKMLLVTLGYDAERAGLVGTGWGQKTTALADENGLLEDVFNGTTQGLQRQYAAQMMYNAIDAPTVVWRDDAYTSTNVLGWDNETIGQKYMGLQADDEGILTSVAKEEGRDTYTISVNGIADGNFTRVAEDYSDLLGQKVKVLYKDKDEVYGVFATDDGMAVTVLANDLDDLDQNRFTADGASLRAEDDKDGGDIPVKVTPSLNVETAYDTLSEVKADYPYFTVTLIDSDGNDRIDTAVVTPIVAAQIDYIGASSVTISAVQLDGKTAAANISGSYDIDDEIVLYEDAAEDDYVAVVDKDFSVSGDTEVTKLENVSGTVTATRASGKEFRIDGTWYTLMTADTVSVNDEVEAAVIGTFAFSIDATASSVSASNILFVADAAEIISGMNNGDYEAEVYFADGTSDTVRLTKYEGKSFTDSQNNSIDEDALIGKMFKFSKDGSNYEIKELTQGSYDDLIGAVDGTNLKDGRLTTKDKETIRFADEAIVFVKTGDDTTVVSGATVNGWNELVDADINNVQALVNESNGYAYARIACINLNTDSIPGGTYQYGYVTSKVNNVADDMYEFDLYTGEDDPITVVTDEIVVGDASVAEGAFIKYSVVADDEIEVKEIKTVSDAVAINGFDASTIAFAIEDGNFDLADGYVVIGADTKDADNIVGGSLRKADTINGVTYLNAVHFIEDNEVAAVFMGNENRIYDADGKAMTLGNASLEEKTYSATVSEDAEVPSDTVDITIEGTSTDLSTGDTVTVKVAKNDGKQFGAGTYTLTVEGADAPEAQEITANSVSEITFEVTVGTSDITVTGVTKE